MDEVTLLFIMFLISSTTTDMLMSQEKCTFKDKSLVPNIRKNCMLKIFISQIVIFSAIFFSVLWHNKVLQCFIQNNKSQIGQHVRMGKITIGTLISYNFPLNDLTPL